MHRQPITLTFLVAVLVAVPAGKVSAENDWPRFRGRHGGVADDSASLPDTWSRTENVVWRIEVPGRAWSSPIVSGDQVFVISVENTSGVETPLKPLSQYQSRSFDGPMTGDDLETPEAPLRWALYAIDFETGQVRWERTLHTAVPGSKHEKNSYASETPVTDGEHGFWNGLTDKQRAEVWFHLDLRRIQWLTTPVDIGLPPLPAVDAAPFRRGAL